MRERAGERHPSWRRGARFELVLFVSALVLRLVYALPRAVIPEINDMGVYDQLATSWLAGDGYVSSLEPHFQSFRAPGYPLFLAGLYAVFGHTATPVVVAQSLLGAATVLLVHRLALAWFDPRAAPIAAWWCVVNPELIYRTPLLLTETLYIALVVLLFVHWTALYRDFRWGRCLVAALALGLATLVRPVLFPIFALAGGTIALWSDGSVWRRLVRGAAFGCVAVAVLVPWSVRNYRVHGEIVPVATIGGISLFNGIAADWSEAQGHALPQAAWRYLEQGLHQLPNGYRMMPELFGRPPTRAMPDDFDEVEQSRRGQELFFRYVLDYPGRFARLVSLKVSMAFSPLPKYVGEQSLGSRALGRGDPAMRLAGAVFWFASFALGGLGCVLARDRFGPRTLLLLFLGFQVALQTVSLPALRYFLPALVAASPFVGAGAIGLADRLRGRVAWRRGEAVAAVAWLAALTLNTWFQLWVLRREKLSSEIEGLWAFLGWS